MQHFFALVTPCCCYVAIEKITRSALALSYESEDAKAALKPAVEAVSDLRHFMLGMIGPTNRIHVVLEPSTVKLLWSSTTVCPGSDQNLYSWIS